MNDLRKELKHFYDEEGLTDYQANRYTTGNFFANRIKDEIVESVKRKMHNFSAYNIADIGSAEGLYLREINNKKGISLCLDLSYPKLKRALHRISECEKTFFVTADVEYLPIKRGLFNGVICSEVLEHVPNPEKAIKEIGDIIKKDGTLFLSIPTGKDRFIPIEISDESDYMTDSGHLHEFSKQDINQILKKNGFYVQTVITVDVFGEVRGVLNQFLRKIIRGGKSKSKKSGTNSENSSGSSKSISQKKVLKNLYIKLWGYMDIFASSLPFLKKKGHFAVFIATKVS